MLRLMQPQPTACLRRPQKQKAPTVRKGLFVFGVLTMTYFRMGNPYYHWRNAVSRPCSGWEGVGPARYARQEFCGRAALRSVGTEAWPTRSGGSKVGCNCIWARYAIRLCLWTVFTATQGYRVKPHGQLVLVSLTHYCASTPSLSTSSSLTNL